MRADDALRSAWFVAVAIAASSCGAGRAECPPSATAASGSGPLAGYSWLAGTWASTDDQGARTEESWTVPRGTIMPGTSHTEDAAGETRSWESLRIERRGEIVQYVALPAGADAETAFHAVELQPGLAVFENVEHEYPQRITYALEAEGVLRATVSDIHGANPHSWVFHREPR